MAPTTVRADYDQLKQVAAGFSQNSQSLQQMAAALKQNKETLQGGDWVGQGATAFYKEMDDSVLPTLQRLTNALDTAAADAGQISAIMKDAEDQAASVLKGSGAASDIAASGSATSGSATSGSGATSSSTASGNGSTSGGAGSASGTGGASGAGGASPASHVATPPDAHPSTRQTVEHALGGVGMVAEIVSILEAGGAAGAAAAGGTVAAAGIGTTVGALILPIGAFLLGTSIAEEREREEQLMDTFKMKMRGSALLESAKMASAQVQAAGVPVSELNAQGMAAVKQVQATWKDTMNDDMDQQLMQDQFINHGHPEAAWQARYDKWTAGMAKDLANIYANRLMTK